MPTENIQVTFSDAAVLDVVIAGAVVLEVDFVPSPSISVAFSTPELAVQFSPLPAILVNFEVPVLLRAGGNAYFPSGW